MILFTPKRMTLFNRRFMATSSTLHALLFSVTRKQPSAEFNRLEEKAFIDHWGSSLQGGSELQHVFSESVSRTL